MTTTLNMQGGANNRPALGTACSIWRGELNKSGYGLMRVGERVVLAHRWAYEQARGPIPTGAKLDHLCRNRACANPDHLEPVTVRENTLRGIGPTAVNARKTHCSRGHEFTEANTVLRPDGSRRCRACNNEQNGRRTACKQGHTYAEGNIVRRADGSRQCKICLDAKRSQAQPRAS